MCARSTGATPTGTGCSTAYLGTGLTAGDKCICVVDSPSTAKRLESLPGGPGGPGSPDGQLDIHLPESTYLAGGEFTTSDMLAFWTENIAKAEIEGYSFCRLVGEMTWALRDAPGVEHLVGYESELNRVTPTTRSSCCACTTWTGSAGRSWSTSSRPIRRC